MTWKASKEWSLKHHYLFGGILALLVTASLWPQEKPAEKPAQPLPVGKAAHGRGRVPPKDLKALYEHSRDKYLYKLLRLPRATAPSYDCRTLGIVAPVMDQGQCGSCWDFSGSEVVTNALIKAGWGKNDGTFQISTQYTLDCYQNGGCNGDDNTTVLAQAKNVGLPLASTYGPYQGSPGSCNQNPGTLYKIQDWGFCTTNNNQGVANTQDIKNAMVAYGPIGCAVAAAGGDFDSYTNGVMTGNDTNIDHDVMIVGWDDSKGNGGAWLVQNSWGTSWGINGYCWIQYGADSIGTEAVWAVAPPNPAPPGPGPVPPGPTPPVPPIPPVPPVPPGPPTPGPTAAITLTSDQTLTALRGNGSVILGPDQVQSVISQSGATVITSNMSAKQLLEAIERCRAQVVPGPWNGRP